MSDGLQVAPGLALPRDVITETLAILAVKRSGKSNNAVTLAEQMFAAALPFTVIDPKGDWWGMRSNRDGSGPGLPIPVFGGSHGDAPLEPGAGRMIADLIFDENLTCILDVSDLDEGEDRLRFLADFADQLYKRHKAHPQPRHLFLEEAHEVIPQALPPGAAKCRRAWIRIIKLGGTAGLGITIISQRSAAVDKDGLSQIETLIAGRTTHEPDQDAIKGWFRSRDRASRDILDQLAGLANGEAYVVSRQWLPSHGLPAVQLVTFARRSTYDSGRTPTLDAAARPPATTATVDLTAIGARIAELAEQAGQDDPERLRARIRQLEQQLADKRRAKPAPVVEQVRVITADDRTALERIIAQIGTVAGELGGYASGIMAALATVTPAPAPAAARIREAATVRTAAEVHAAAPAAAPAKASPRPRAAADGAPVLSKAERAILTVLAQNPGGLTKLQTAVLAGYSLKSSSLSNALGALRTAGMITPASVKRIQILAAGLAELDEIPAPLAGPDLVAYWLSRLGLAERTILQVFLDAWPGQLDKPTVAVRSGYSATSSSYSNALGRLRSLGLVDGWTAGDTLATAARTEPAHA